MGVGELAEGGGMIDRQELFEFAPELSLRMEDLRAGKAISRRYRNRRIGEFLKELDLTEGRSMGIPKILRVMKANGSPPPEFESDEDRTHFLIRLPIHHRALQEATPQVTPQVHLLLSAIYGELTRAELMDGLGLKDVITLRKSTCNPRWIPA
jgi:ATP-dependent DNA helicase RecG